MGAIEQFSVFWVDLDPTQGSEIAKTRPCVVVSPNELNNHLRTVIVNPVTSTVKGYPFRVQCRIAGKTGEIATDQIRTIDKNRIKGFISKLSVAETGQLQNVINEMFCQ
jgi:mRNA interferase MazF